MTREMHSNTHFRHQDVDYAAAISIGSSESAAAEHNREQDHSLHVVAGRAKNVPTGPERNVASRRSEHYSAD